jgi:hypothetical protein
MMHLTYGNTLKNSKATVAAADSAALYAALLQQQRLWILQHC